MHRNFKNKSENKNFTFGLQKITTELNTRTTGIIVTQKEVYWKNKIKQNSVSFSGIKQKDNYILSQKSTKLLIAFSEKGEETLLGHKKLITNRFLMPWKFNSLKNKQDVKIWQKYVKPTRNSKVLNKHKFWFWESLNKALLKTSYGSEFLLGGASVNTNTKWCVNFLMSKNNIEIFNTYRVRIRLIALYAAFKWVNSASIFGIFYKNLKFMFASHTPVFANLMSWAGLMTNGVSSSNRWLPGRVSAQTNLKFLPNYLFIPDPDENAMITREAWQKKIPVISINNSDSKFIADIGVYGNNRSFKLIFKTVQILIRLSKNKKKVSQLLLDKNVSFHKRKWFTLASQRILY